MGYHRAGFEVVGIDIEPQPHYPFEFHQADALAVLSEYPWDQDWVAVHASPPCQAYSNAQKLRGNVHPDLIGPTRELLESTGLPYVIENVVGAPLRDPVTLCGAMFGLRTYRHRLFETNWELAAPEHPPHVARTTKMGRPPGDGEFMHVVGNFSGVAEAREAMGIDWMPGHRMREAIPPAYTEWIGAQLLRVVRARSAGN